MLLDTDKAIILISDERPINISWQGGEDNIHRVIATIAVAFYYDIVERALGAKRVNSVPVSISHRPIPNMIVLRPLPLQSIHGLDIDPSSPLRDQYSLVSYGRGEKGRKYAPGML